MKPLDHSRNSVRRYGGALVDYLEIHEFLDQTKYAHPDMRHRAILHNSMGPFLAAQIFGRTITVNEREIDVRQVCEDHIIEDLGRLPALTEFLNLIPESEMSRFAYKMGRKVTPALED